MATAISMASVLAMILAPTITPNVAKASRCSVSACDQTIAGNIANHDLGKNQTIIDLAKQYLALRGIQ